MRRKNDAGNAAVVTLASILAAVLLIGLGVVGWQFDWWLKAKNTDKATDVTRRSLQYQTARVDEIRSAMKNFLDYDIAASDPRRALSAASNRAAAQNALDDICAKYGELHGSVPSDITSFIAKHPCE